MKVSPLPVLLACSAAAVTALGCAMTFALLNPPVARLPVLAVRWLPAPPKWALRKCLNLTAVIRSAAQKHRVPSAFVKSIMAAESNFNCDAVSPKGAIGLMQLMPETAQQLGADPTVPEENVDAGTRYLRILMDRYCKYRNSMKRVIAAYNAGPGVVDRYRGVPPYRETRQYVLRVLVLLRHFQREG